MTAAAYRFDPAPAAPAVPDARALAGALRALLTDPALRLPRLREERAAVRYAAEAFALALKTGRRPDLAAAHAVVRAVTDARDRAVAGAGDLDRLRAVRTDLAAADPHAGPRTLAFARGVLAGVRDLAAAGPFTPDDLLSSPVGNEPAGRAFAAAKLAAWAGVQFRELAGAAEPLVVAALARDLPGGNEDAERDAALLALAGLPAAAVRAARCRRERPDGGGPLRVPGEALTAGDRLVAWADRFVDLAATSPFPDAAAATYAAGRRGELCLRVVAAGLEALGLDRGDQGAADSAGVAPVGLALTDLGRTRLRLDAAHALSAPKYARPRPACGNPSPRG